jgi:hypothetical protein
MFQVCGGNHLRFLINTKTSIQKTTDLSQVTDKLYHTEYPEKTTDLSQVADKLYHITFYRVHLAWAGFKLATLVVIGTGCIGSSKSNYHTITARTFPNKKEI